VSTDLGTGDGLQAGDELFSLERDEAAELLALVAAGRGDEKPATDVQPEPDPKPFEVPVPSPSAPVSVQLLGAYRIEVGGTEIRSGLRTKAREVLAFLLLHPEGVSGEAAVDALWPEAPPGRGIEGFRRAVGNVRARVRARNR